MDEMIRNGHAPNGKQKYLCYKCKRQSRENPTPNVCSEEKKEEIVRAYEERSSLRGLERIFGVSRPTVIKWLKKKAKHLPELSETLIEPDPNDANATILEFDELWSFVLKKVNTSWIWIALCRKTQQVVSYAIADRSKETDEKLWNKILLVYRAGNCFTDLYSVYKKI